MTEFSKFCASQMMGMFMKNIESILRNLQQVAKTVGAQRFHDEGLSRCGFLQRRQLIGKTMKLYS